MPNTNSAKKRLRQNVAQRIHNRAIKSEIKTQFRNLRAILTAGNVEETENLFRVMAQKLDRAAARNIIHPNRAGRIKSRFQRRIRMAKQSA